MEIKNKKKLIFSFMFILIGFGIFVTAQVVSDTQVIDLAEKARDFFIEATKGNIKGQSTDLKFGENLAVGTVEEDIQSQGGVLVFLESAELISIISSDTTNDILTGSNARQVHIFGLDKNFSKIDEFVNLSATPKNTTKKYIRVYRMHVEIVGTYGATNLGTITGTSSLSGTTQIEIPALLGQSQSTHYTVPAGHKLIVKSFRITMDTGKEIDFFAKIRENSDITTGDMGAVRVVRTARGVDTPLVVETFGDTILNEKTDLWATAISSVGVAKVEVDYDFLEFQIGS